MKANIWQRFFNLKKRTGTTIVHWIRGAVSLYDVRYLFGIYSINKNKNINKNRAGKNTKNLRTYSKT